MAVKGYNLELYRNKDIMVLQVECQVEELENYHKELGVLYQK